LFVAGFGSDCGDGFILGLSLILHAYRLMIHGPRVRGEIEQYFLDHMGFCEVTRDRPRFLLLA